MTVKFWLKDVPYLEVDQGGFYNTYRFYLVSEDSCAVYTQNKEWTNLKHVHALHKFDSPLAAINLRLCIFPFGVEDVVCYPPGKAKMLTRAYEARINSWRTGASCGTTRNYFLVYPAPLKTKRDREAALKVGKLMMNGRPLSDLEEPVPTLENNVSIFDGNKTFKKRVISGLYVDTPFEKVSLPIYNPSARLLTFKDPKEAAKARLTYPNIMQLAQTLKLAAQEVAKIHAEALKNMSLEKRSAAKGWVYTPKESWKVCEFYDLWTGKV